MASIVGKRRGNQTYYYLVESARVDGKPRIVSQQYLGSAEEVMAKLSETPAGGPQRSQHKRFGDLAAVWSMLARLDVAGIVDEVVPRRARRGRVGGHLYGVGVREPDRGPVLEAGLRRLVGHHGRATVGEAAPGRAGSPPVLGRDGPARRGGAARDRDPARAADGHRVRAGPVRAGAGHDQLRHVHRLRQRRRRRSRSAARPSRNAPICGWSGWRWSSPATAGCR